MFSDTVDPPHVGRNPNPNPGWVDCVDMVPHFGEVHLCFAQAGATGA